jgi:hypothetical protein
MHPVSELDTAAVDRRVLHNSTMIIAGGEHLSRGPSANFLGSAPEPP